jgi:hypothetical protein
MALHVNTSGIPPQIASQTSGAQSRVQESLQRLSTGLKLNSSEGNTASAGISAWGLRLPEGPTGGLLNRTGRSTFLPGPGAGGEGAPQMGGDGAPVAAGVGGLTGAGGDAPVQGSGHGAAEGGGASGADADAAIANARAASGAFQARPEGVDR